MPRSTVRRVLALGSAAGVLGAAQWAAVHGRTDVAGYLLLGAVVCTYGHVRTLTDTTDKRAVDTPDVEV